MSENAGMIHAEAILRGAVRGEIGVGRYVVNDYVLTLSEIENGYSLEIRKGSEVQTAVLHQGEKGDPGDDYVLTEADKDEIADLAADKIDLDEYVKSSDTSVVTPSGDISFGGGLALSMGGGGTRDTLTTANAISPDIKAGRNWFNPIVPGNQHEAVFYGLAKAAGDSTQAAAARSVGNYTDDAKAAIQNMLDIQSKNALPLNRVTSLNGTVLSSGVAIEAHGTPVYVDDPSDYSAYGLTETGWYVFARIAAKPGVYVLSSTTVEGAAGYIATPYTNHIDVAVRFDVAAMSQIVTVNWGSETETYIFKATDLAVRNLDYRTTFYVYDIAPYATWEYALTTDATFVADKQYYTKDGDEYTLAEVTAGETVPADAYYNHSRVTFSGMARNITYKCDTVIDCPQVYVLPEIEDDVHGCWYEIRLRHSGSFSSTLQVPEGVKVATEHTQAETAGLNMVDLHYSNVGGVKIWRFLNTHSSIPA